MKKLGLGGEKNPPLPVGVRSLPQFDRAHRKIVIAIVKSENHKCLGTRGMSWQVIGYRTSQVCGVVLGGSSGCSCSVVIVNVGLSYVW